MARKALRYLAKPHLKNYGISYPSLFVDEMVSGAFKSFRHEHQFSQVAGQTIMKDVFEFESPLGILGQLANRLFLKRYMTNLLTTRNTIIKQTAEAASGQRVMGNKIIP